MSVDLIAATLSCHNISVDHFRRRDGWCWWCSCHVDGEQVHPDWAGAYAEGARHQAEQVTHALASDPETAAAATHQRVSRYTVCAVPKTVPLSERHLFEVEVEDRGAGWAVTHLRWCLNTNGQWDFEPLPSERDPEWLASHRFDLSTALRLARQAAPDVTVNGVRAVDLAGRAEVAR